MPVDWNALDRELDDIIKESGDRTDAKLASKISSLTRMTDDEVQSLFPDPADVKKLSELMQIVKSADERNTRVNHLVLNAEKFGGVVLTLIEKFA